MIEVPSKVQFSFTFWVFMRRYYSFTCVIYASIWHNACAVRDGPLEKWWGGGGWGKTPKKILQGKMPRQKIHAKKKVKKKNSCRRKVQLWLFQKVWVSFRKSEFQKSTVLPGTIWINKNHFLLVERRQLEPCFCFKLQLVYLQHTLYWLYTVYTYIHTYPLFKHDMV